MKNTSVFKEDIFLGHFSFPIIFLSLQKENPKFSSLSKTFFFLLLPRIPQFTSSSPPPCFSFMQQPFHSLRPFQMRALISQGLSVARSAAPHLLKRKLISRSNPRSINHRPSTCSPRLSLSTSLSPPSFPSRLTLARRCLPPCPLLTCTCARRHVYGSWSLLVCVCERWLEGQQAIRARERRREREKQ